MASVSAGKHSMLPERPTCFPTTRHAPRPGRRGARAPKTPTAAARAGREGGGFGHFGQHGPRGCRGGAAVPRDPRPRPSAPRPGSSRAAPRRAAAARRSCASGRPSPRPRGTTSRPRAGRCEAARRRGGPGAARRAPRTCPRHRGARCASVGAAARTRTGPRRGPWPRALGEPSGPERRGAGPDGFRGGLGRSRAIADVDPRPSTTSGSPTRTGAAPSPPSAPCR